ncbi:MAG: hypothetical protein J1E99_05185 [Muribaculaceae bacterium]|nr:hypothetical protein [Muribaculaceae bacterium]
MYTKVVGITEGVVVRLSGFQVFRLSRCLFGGAECRLRLRRGFCETKFRAFFADKPRDFITT